MPEPIVSHADLPTILREFAATKPAMAVATPQHQRLAMTAWIARARASRRLLPHQVGQVARVLHDLSQLWWPGNVLALSRTTPPSRVFPDSAQPLRSWDAVADEATARRERAPGWADDHARSPRPHDPAAMFAAACDVLTVFGGPLGGPRHPSPAAIHAASTRLVELERVAAELRWLRGCVDPMPWAAAIGRLRRIVRELGPGGAAIAAILDPGYTLTSWARHLGRDPLRESVLAEIPTADSPGPAVLDWLLRAFDVFDTPTLLDLCRPYQPQVLALRPELTNRRHRRRLTALQSQLLGAGSAAATPIAPAAAIEPVQADLSRIEHARTQFAGQRALFISNRSFPELEVRLHDELGLDCEAVASVDAPRRRHALVQRIRSGSYDLVLVAHDFSGHADTEQFAAACRSANILYCAVGKGRFTRVVSCLLAARCPRAAARDLGVPHAIVHHARTGAHPAMVNA